jgi:hypothetical protein
VVRRGGVERLEPIGFWTAVGLSLLLLALLAVTTSGYLVQEPAPAESAGAAALLPAETPRSAAALPERRSPPHAAVVAITAARGDCWVEARRASARGELLFAGLLVRGQSRRLRASRVWLRLGAGENVDVTVGGRRATVPRGTGEVLLRSSA